MNRLAAALLFVFTSVPTGAVPPIELDEDSFRPGGSVISLGINWGRKWKCGAYENAQLQALTFRKAPLSVKDGPTIEARTPSKLFVDDRFLRYAFVVEPGEYVLTGFDVKVARSVNDVGRLKATETDLIKDGEPFGGSFTVNPGEVVYLGHFGLDCAVEPFFWRYYLKSREDFEAWVARFREEYPYAQALAPKFRLFATTTLGKPFSLDGAEE